MTDHTKPLPPADTADPTHGLNEMEKAVFGHNAKRHPICGFVIEQGSGAHPPDIQALMFCANLERVDPEAAAAMRRRLEIAKK